MTNCDASPMLVEKVSMISSACPEVTTNWPSTPAPWATSQKEVGTAEQVTVEAMTFMVVVVAYETDVATEVVVSSIVVVVEIWAVAVGVV
jgi:hypothetical protein